MGQFATGVAVVSAFDAGGAPRGMTVNSLTSVSLEPPLLLYGLDCSAVNYQTFAAAERFALAILTRDQEKISNRFADPTRPDWPEAWPWQGRENGAPLLEDAALAIACRRERAVEVADHLIIFGRAEIITGSGSEEPLLYHGGRYRGLAR